MSCLTRRKFLSTSLKAGGYLLLSGSPSIFPLTAEGGEPVPLAISVDPDPAMAFKKAVDLLGGMRKLISKGDVVLVKPNIGWDRVPEQAANTSPPLVVSIVRELLEAGAKEVRIFDRTCNEPRRSYINSGIEPAIRDFSRKEGVEDMVRVYHVSRRKFVRVEIEGAKVLKKWPLYRDALEVDRVVNVPVAKHHSLAGYTLSLKNMMGIMGDNRGQIHWRLPSALADLNSRVKTDLAVIDGSRILLRNGPSGGNLDDVERKDTIIVSPNPVAADAHAARVLFNVEPERVPHIREASVRGLGPIGKGLMDIREA